MNRTRTLLWAGLALIGTAIGGLLFGLLWDQHPGITAFVSLLLQPLNWLCIAIWGALARRWPTLERSYARTLGGAALLWLVAWSLTMPLILGAWPGQFWLPTPLAPALFIVGAIAPRVLYPALRPSADA